MDDEYAVGLDPHGLLVQVGQWADAHVEGFQEMFYRVVVDHPLTVGAGSDIGPEPLPQVADSTCEQGLDWYQSVVPHTADLRKLV